MPKVLNKRIHGIPKGAVYVGRPSPYGNPYHMRSEADRDRVCDMFEQALLRKFERDPDAKRRLKEALRGKDLVCWCAPKRCHADVLLKYANEED
jgi:hypothetical protein